MKVNKKGYQVYEWVKKYERNEPLDCRVYARAAACVVGLDRYENSETFWNNMQAVPAQKKEEKKKEQVKRTSFWG
jgi:phage terminase large subunit GpA-like protein